MTSVITEARPADTRRWGTLIGYTNGTYRFECDDTCRYPGITGRVWHHDELGWLAEVDGMIQDMPFGGATPREAAQNAMQGAWDGIQWKHQMQARGRW